VFLIIDKVVVLSIMRNTMPAVAPKSTDLSQAQLKRLGRQIRAQRKALGVNATAAAESAGMSRVTLHRIEKGEPSVTMGAYINAISVLGLELALLDPLKQQEAGSPADERQGWIPARVSLSDYPQLKQLAWQVHGTNELTPIEALNIYERNMRHVDIQALDARERQLIDALRTAFKG
jgi:transcriptional regulator with XRE-family HTH domain